MTNHILLPDSEHIAVQVIRGDEDLAALGSNLSGEARCSTRVPKDIDSPYIQAVGQFEAPSGTEAYHTLNSFIQFNCFAWLDRKDIKPDPVTAKLVARTLIAKLGVFSGFVGGVMISGIQVNAGPVRMPDSQRGWAWYRVDTTWTIKGSGE